MTIYELKNRARQKSKYLLVGLVAALFVNAAAAHPHSWIEMKTHINGQDGIITSLSMEWSFDAITSIYMLDGEDVSPDKEQETLHNLSMSVLNNMKDEHYFTHFYDGEKTVKYGLARNAKMTRDKAKLVLSFEIPFTKPLPVTRDSLKLLIYEPSYYVDMAWRSTNDVVLSPELARQCQVNIIEPNPTPEQMSYAMSLPADADPDNTLGHLFTQTANIHCANVSDSQ